MKLLIIQICITLIQLVTLSIGISPFYQCSQLNVTFQNVASCSWKYTTQYDPQYDIYNFHLYNITCTNLDQDTQLNGYAIQVVFLDDPQRPCTGEPCFLDPTSRLQPECDLDCFGMPFGLWYSFQIADPNNQSSKYFPGSEILVYGNTTYPYDDNHLLSPENPVLTQHNNSAFVVVCEEFDEQPITNVPGMTCMEFVSNFSAYSDELDGASNIILTVTYYDQCEGFEQSCMTIYIDQHISGIFDAGELYMLTDDRFPKIIFNWLHPNLQENPITVYLNSDSNYIGLGLEIYNDINGDCLNDNSEPCGINALAVQFYSIDGLRLKSNLEPFTPNSPYDNNIPVSIGPLNSQLNVSTYCNKFIPYNVGSTTTPKIETNPCPNGWQFSKLSHYNNTQKCYNVLQFDNSTGADRTYANAQDSCKKIASTYGKTGSLVSIDNVFANMEYTEIYQKNYNLMCKNEQEGGAYIGLKRNSNIQPYFWLNGDASTYRNWALYATAKSFDCARFGAYHVEGTWDTSDCNNKDLFGVGYVPCYACEMII